MKKAYLICNHTVPTAHPNGVRFANLGLIFRELGYEVCLIGREVGETEKAFSYKGMDCFVWSHKESIGFKNAMKREAAYCKYIQKLLDEKGAPDIIVSGLPNDKAQRYLISYCEKYNVKMAQSTCEWFDKNNFVGLSGMVKFLNDRYGMHIQIPGIRHVIVISSLLGNYYLSRGCNVVRVPTMVDFDEYQNLSHKENEKLIIAYAGSPAKKDYITNAVKAVALLDPQEQAQLELHLYGIKTENLVALGISPSLLEQCGDSIVCHGRIPYEQVKGNISAADFTVLLRPDKRYANAGFPTKVGESMACGTPVIANLTSDLGKYIIDGQTGIVCADETPESCAEAFRKAVQMSAEARLQMRNAAEQMARTGFSYASYVEDMAAFIKKAESENTRE